MRFNPWLLILIVVAIFFFAGGNYYSAGTYRPYGMGIGGILLLLFVLYLFGVL